MNTEIRNQNRSEAALAWAQGLEKDHKTNANALNETLLAFQINQLLEAFNFDQLKTKMENGKDYRDVVGIILEQSSERTKRLKVELELQTYKENVTAQKQKIGDALEKGEMKKGLSPETLRIIEAAMARM
ncbi:MAG: hypothetical protein JWO95_1078 [Verrucomicrobiales bacterium]|nr:hypothetical protein [Verrucomicrobiales bacterium]